MMETLIKNRVGLREVEEYVRKESTKMRGGETFKPREEIVMGVMKAKIKDNISFGIKLRRKRASIRTKIERTLGKNSSQYRRILKESKEERETLRKKLKKRGVMMR